MDLTMFLFPKKLQMLFLTLKLVLNVNHSQRTAIKSILNNTSIANSKFSGKIQIKMLFFMWPQYKTPEMGTLVFTKVNYKTGLLLVYHGWSQIY
jgi:hypothetical protein